MIRTKLISISIIILLSISGFSILTYNISKNTLNEKVDFSDPNYINFNNYRNDEFNNSVEDFKLTSSRSINNIQPIRSVTTSYGANIIKLIAGREVTGKTFQLNRNNTVTDTILSLKGLPSFDLNDWGPISCVSDHKLDGLSDSPIISLDRYDNPHIVWSDTGKIDGSEGDWDIVYITFDSNTESWTREDIISVDEPNSISKSPDFLIDDSDTIHFVWVDNADISNNDKDQDIFYRTRSLKGDSWGETKVVSNRTGLGKSEHPKIAINSSNDIFVVWQDNEGIISNGTDNDILCKIKYNKNDTWSRTFCLSNNSADGESKTPAIAADGDKIHVVWVESGNIDNSGFDNDVVMRSWNGRFWEEEVIISNLIYDQNSSRPALAASKGVISVAWVEDGDEDINSTDNDIISVIYESGEWNKEKVVTDNINEGDSTDPDVKIDIEGNIHIVWTDEDFSFRNIFYRRWDTINRKWSKVIKLSDYEQTGISTEPKLVVTKDLRVDLVWTDNAEISDNGLDPDIFYKKSKSIYPSNLKLNIVRTNGTELENGDFDWYNPGELRSELLLNLDLFPERLNTLVKEMTNTVEEFKLNFTSATNGSLLIVDFRITTTHTPNRPLDLSITNEVIDHVVTHRPTFAWEFSDNDSTVQSGFEMIVGSEPGLDDLWNFGPIESNKESEIYNGEPLIDGETYYCQVRLKDEQGAWSPWSDPLGFTMNSIPEIKTLTPVSGSADEEINIDWVGNDDNNDSLNYTLDVWYDGVWHRLLENSNLTEYVFDSSNLSNGKSVDIKCRAYDGFETSNWFNDDGFITIYHNTPPKIFVLTPTKHSAIANESFQILWESIDPDDEEDLFVNIYLDRDTDFSLKILIAQDISDTGSYNWDSSSTEEGVYFICLEISDGRSSNYDYSEGTVTINHKIDTRPPKVITTEPSDGIADVPLNKRIRIRFSKEIDPITLENGNFYIKNSLGREVEGKIQWDSTFKEFTFTPNNNLEYSQVYTVTLRSGNFQNPGITDTLGYLLDGNYDNFEDGSPLDDVVWSFSTLPWSVIKPPKIVSTTPNDNDEDISISPIITILFSDRIERNSTTDSTIFIIDEQGNYIDGEMYLISNQNELQISFLENLEYDTTYTLFITAQVRNELGYGLDGNSDGTSDGSPKDDYSFKFKTKEFEENGINGDSGTGFDQSFLLIILLLLIPTIALLFYIFRSPERTKEFKIHDIFVIYNDGRLIAHNTVEKKSNIDEGSMSGMLTAIQNFVAESFIDIDEDEEKLEEIKYGKLKIFLLHGTSIYMAVISSGEVNAKKFKSDMEKILSLIEIKFGDELTNWDGNMKKIRDIGDLIKF